jgi:hypothetical protein
METMHRDYYPKDDRKQTAKTTMIDHVADKLAHDNKEGEDNDDTRPGKDNTVHEEQCTAHAIPETTKPNSRCRCIADHLENKGAPDLCTAAKHPETWTAVLRDEDHLLTSLGQMSGPSARHPVLFLALDADTLTVVLLHHLGIASGKYPQRLPHFAALCMDRIDEDTPPQVVCAKAEDLCQRVIFSKPKVTNEDINKLAAGDTLVSGPATKSQR